MTLVDHKPRSESSVVNVRKRGTVQREQKHRNGTYGETTGRERFRPLSTPIAVDFGRHPVAMPGFIGSASGLRILHRQDLGILSVTHQMRAG